MKPCRIPASAPLCLAVVIAVLLAPLGTKAQVLQQVPGDALLVVKFNKLKATSDKIAALAQKLGLAQLSPEMADPLGSAQTEAGIKEGLDPAGDAAFVLLNSVMDGDDPPAILLIPVTDYKAFLGNFADAKTEGEISTVHPKNEPSDVFVTNWGKYAVMSPKKEFLSKKPDGFKATALSAKELDAKDVVAYVNMKVARTRILPEMAKGRAKVSAEVEKGMMRASAPPRQRTRPGQPPATRPAAAAPNVQQQKMIPLVKAFVNRCIDVAEQVVTDADGASYGLVINDAGINTTGLVEFAAASPSATRVAGFKNTDASLLKGVPAQKYLLFGGSAADPKTSEKLVADFLAPIQKEFAALGAEGATLQKYVDAIKKMCAASSGQTFGMLTPSGILGQDAVIQFVSITRGDAKTILEAQKDMADSQQAFMNMFQPANSGMQMKSTFTANAKTINGVALNSMQSSFAPPAGQQASPQVAQMQQMMAVMYGPGGVNVLTGAVNDKIAITSMGASDDIIKQLVDSAKADDDKLAQSPGVAIARKNLPPNRFIEFFVGLDQIAATGANYAKAFGMPINFQVPPDLAPIGFTIATEGGNALKGDAFISSQTLQSLIAAGMQTYMQMQGGQQPGGPGGL